MSRERGGILHLGLIETAPKASGTTVLPTTAGRSPGRCEATKPPCWRGDRVLPIIPNRRISMRRTGYGLIVAAMLAVGVPVLAQKPANAPAKATAQCTDGTFSTAKTEKGACSKHGGVKSWFGPAAAPATP